MLAGCHRQITRLSSGIDKLQCEENITYIDCVLYKALKQNQLFMANWAAQCAVDKNMGPPNTVARLLQNRILLYKRILRHYSTFKDTSSFPDTVAEDAYLVSFSLETHET